MILSRVHTTEEAVYIHFVYFLHGKVASYSSFITPRFWRFSLKHVRAAAWRFCLHQKSFSSTRFFAFNRRECRLPGAVNLFGKLCRQRAFPLHRIIKSRFSSCSVEGTSAKYHLTFRKSFIVGVNCRHVNFGSSERRRGQDPVKQGRRHFVFACLQAKSTSDSNLSPPLGKNSVTLCSDGLYHSHCYPSTSKKRSTFFSSPFPLCSSVLFHHFNE